MSAAPLPTPDTQGDWDEMPFLAANDVGLIKDVLFAVTQLCA